jgi:hypothetical protein
LITGAGGNAAGNIVALRGTGVATLGVQGSSVGEWDIAAPANFTSWTFTPPPTPCAPHQWWTTDVGGTGSCSQPGFSDLSGAVAPSQLAFSFNGDLTGPILSPAVSRVNGTTVPTNAVSDQVLLTTAPSVATWTTIPTCTDTAGNHLNYDPSTHSFSCGASGIGGSNSVTHVTGQLTAGVPVIGNGGGDVKVAAATGNTTTFVTSAGSRASGDCARWDADGNLVDSGAACAATGGGGSSVAVIGGSMGISTVAPGSYSFYVPFGANTALGSAYWLTPVSGNLQKLYILPRTGGFSQPSDNAAACTAYVNGNSTALAVIIPAGYTSSSSPPFGTLNDLTHTVPVNSGDAIVLKCVNNSSSPSINLVSWTAVIQ